MQSTDLAMPTFRATTHATPSTARRPFKVRLVAINPEGFSSALAFLAATVDQQFQGMATVEQLIYDSEDVRNRGFDVSLAISDIVKDGPDIIGLSWYSWNDALVRHIAKLVTELLPDAALIVGGPQTRTAFEPDLMTLPAGTVLVFGEGEQTFCQLIDAVLAEDTLSRLPEGSGLVTGEGIRRGKPRTQAIPLQSLPSPILTGHFHEPNGRRLPSYSTTRGCVFRCSFCAWHDNLNERLFPLDKVLAELDVIAGKNYEMVWFTDTIFGRDVERGLAILKHLEGWGGRTKFGFEMHAQFLDPALVEGIARLPIDFAAIGVQSLAPGVLRLSKRSPKTQKLHDAIDLLYRRMPDRGTVHIDLIFGMPEQTLDDCLQSVSELLEKYPDATLFCSMLQLIPGTAFERYRQEPGWVCLSPEGDYEVVSTPTLQGDDLLRLRDLLVGLDAMWIARRDDDAGLRLSAEQAETVGKALRGSRFHNCPTAYRQGLMTWKDVEAAGQEVIRSYS
ncbi:Radical SAM superfamily enzyme YgiQ, UPF0313 family [Amycolatopsis xylanica]|uniref:Radical SAM superfamily enzyme YgiQ, UPF0313 family n=1 Tax=Amycolatopsis xylanica TaxID=589385 RepID=A0A1H3SCD8_9PSEU|nr:Radical SAM superfamily enzyme YgiQ, UPF0313 family [Amycolatopsis xylanica]